MIMYRYKSIVYWKRHDTDLDTHTHTHKDWFCMVKPIIGTMVSDPFLFSCLWINRIVFETKFSFYCYCSPSIYWLSVQWLQSFNRFQFPIELMVPGRSSSSSSLSYHLVNYRHSYSGNITDNRKENNKSINFILAPFNNNRKVIQSIRYQLVNESHIHINMVNCSMRN